MKKNIYKIGKLMIAVAIFSVTVLLSMEKNKDGKWRLAFSLAMAQTSSGISGSGSGSDSGSGTSGTGDWELVGETEGEDVYGAIDQGDNVSGTDECPSCVKDMMIKLKKCSKEWAKYDSNGKRLQAGFTTGTKKVCKDKTSAYCDQNKQVACDAPQPTS